LNSKAMKSVAIEKARRLGYKGASE
jgi:hypothetical protein